MNPGDTLTGGTAGPGRDITSLNEGRGVNPGDTLFKLGLGLGRVIAQRRPGREPRRHDRDEFADAPVLIVRSTKAGA